MPGRVKTSYPRIQRMPVPPDCSGESRQAPRHAVPTARKLAAKIPLVCVRRR